MVRFRINANPMYESNKNIIVDMHHNSYIAFGHAGSCNVWITTPVTDSAGDGICQSQQTQVIPWLRRVLTYFKFRFLKRPLDTPVAHVVLDQPDIGHLIFQGVTQA